VNRFRYLARILSASLILATLAFSASAFADSRHRNETRGRGYSRGDRPFHHRGQVSRFTRHRGGYYVYVGAPYPFYVPHRYWRPNRFRVGLSVHLGGYYNPRGYYDYYDDDDDRYYGRYRSYDRRGDDRYGEKRFIEATLTGVVESVDERRARFVLKNDATGNLVTVSMLMAEGRRQVRPGDHIAIEGEWTRLGVFDAIEIDLVDD
jgi:hypothetical protein